MRTLLVVDMLNDFIEEDGALSCGPSARAIVPFVRNLIDDVHTNGGKVIHIMDAHEVNDKEFDRFPSHCIRNTKGAQIIPELTFYSDIDHRVKKTRYSGFYRTDLHELIKAADPTEVEVVGVCTSICVMDTVGGLANRDYKIKVWRKGVADFNQMNHIQALRRMENLYGAEIV